MLGIKILQHHIDNGRRGSVRNCPLALAIEEYLADPTKKVEVGLRSFIIFDQNYYYELRNGQLYPLLEYNNENPGEWRNFMSDEAIKFVEDFDRARGVMPCEL